MFKSSKIITIIGAALVGAMLSLPTLAQAKTNANEKAPSVYLHTLRLGYMHTHNNYAEHPSKPYDDTAKGTFPGGYLGYENFSDHFYMDYALSIGKGSTEYNGYKVNYSTGKKVPITTNQTNSQIETHIQVGPALYVFGKRDILAPYVGLTTRIDQDTVAPHTALAIRTRRVALFGDFGLVDRIAFTHNLQAQLKAGAHYLAVGYVRNSDGNSGRYTKHPMSYSASAEVDYRIWRFVGVFAKAEFSKYTLPRVKYNSMFAEPKNRTYEQHYIVGLDLGHF